MSRDITLKLPFTVEHVQTDIQAMWCPEIPGSSGRRCEDRRVRHPPIVVASPSGALGDSLPVDHVGVRGLLPETGHPVRNLATAPNSPRIPVSECLVRTGLVSVGAVGGFESVVRWEFAVPLRLGIDIACRAAHQVSLADEQGRFIWTGRRFRTTPQDLAGLWSMLPKAPIRPTCWW